MTNTDIIVILFLLIQAVNGAYYGFWRAAAKPVALLTALGSAWLYYKATRQLMISCLIGSLGSFVLSWLIGLILKWRTSPDASRELPLISRLSGLAINLAWGMVFAALTVTILTLIPFDKLELTNAGNDVQRSVTLRLLKPVLVAKGLMAEKPPSISSCTNDLCRLDEKAASDLAADEQIKEIANDPIMKKLMHDPQAMAAIKSRDIKAILENPTLKELRENPEFIMKILKVYPKIQQKINASKAPAP